MGVFTTISGFKLLLFSKKLLKKTFLV